MSADPRHRGRPLTGGGLIRVATIPHGDPYADAVLPPDAVRVGPAADPSPWLDVAHLEAHADEIDVLHLHSGDGARGGRRRAVLGGDGAPARPAAGGHRAPAAARGCGRPRSAAEAGYDAHLEAVLATAEVVLTLTPGAADEIADRFGRTAIVVAHPSVAVPDPAAGCRARARRAPPRAAVAGGPGRLGARARGAVGRRLRRGQAAGARRTTSATSAARCASSPTAGSVELVVHPPTSAARAAAATARRRAARAAGDALAGPGGLPRRRHARRRADAAVGSPQQWSEVVSYGTDESGRLDPLSLTGAVGAALTRPMPRPADRGWRAEQRAAVQAVHAAVYRQVAADRALV